jgi:hypothetical protein
LIKILLLIATLILIGKCTLNLTKLKIKSKDI